MLYVKPVPDVDILFTFVTVYLSVFFLSFSYCLPVSGEIKLYKYIKSPLFSQYADAFKYNILMMKLQSTRFELLSGRVHYVSQRR